MAWALLLAGSLAAAQPASAAPSDARDCQGALGPFYEGTEESALPGQVDGAAIRGRDALLALRAERGDALITLRGGDFSGADFRNARLHNLCFLDTNLSGSDWRGAQAEGVGFIRANLGNANLSGARLDRLAIRDANLENANGAGASLVGARLDGGWFEGNVANFRLDGADLTRFRFECGITLADGCPVDQGDPMISLDGANLTEAAIDTYHGLDDWAGARIDRTRVGFGQLEDLASADIAGPLILGEDDETVMLSPADYAALRPHIRTPDQAESPSFDCARAATPVERLLCANESGAMRLVDRIVADLYRRLPANAALAREQQAWLRTRDACPLYDGAIDTGCVRTSYERRRAELIGRVGLPDWARPGAVALFIGAPIAFDDAFRADPLYLRLVPALVAASWGRIVVRVAADGVIEARGDAVGGNAHMCSLTGSGLRLDPATGWISGPQAPNAEDPPLWRGRPMSVLLLWDDWVEVYQGGHSYSASSGDPRISDYASCGARAGFSRMIRVPVSAAEANRLFETFGAN